MILTVTMNPALDKCYGIDDFAVGQVNRVQQMRLTAGGKGLNVARVVCALGEQATATGVLGGFSGKLLLSLLDKPIVPSFIEVSGETRSCINVLNSFDAQSTELLEPGEAVTAEELARFEHHFSELLLQCSVVTISGSLPIGCSTQFYCGLIHKAKQMGKKVLLDTSGKALVAAATAKPTLIKPNVDEIKALVTADVQTPAQAAQAAQQLHSTGIAYVVLSLGCKGAIMACDSGVFYAAAASVKAVNAVGCGDSMLAGLAVGLLHNESPSDCLRMGMAAGAANALTFGTGCVEKAKYEALLTQIKVRDFYENPLTCR